MTDRVEERALPREIVALCCTTHHSLIVEPWPALPGGVHVVQADDPESIVLLLRDRAEVEKVCAALIAALAAEERALPREMRRFKIRVVRTYMIDVDAVDSLDAMAEAVRDASSEHQTSTEANVLGFDPKRSALAVEDLNGEDRG